MARFVVEPTDAPSPFDEGCFIDERRAWVAGFQLKRTTDGGVTWQKLRPSPESETVFGKMGSTYVKPYFLTPTRGWLDASTGIWQTEDGGLTWRQIFSEGSPPRFADSQNGWLRVFLSETTEQSYVTRDGGRSWQRCGPVLKLSRQHPNSNVFFLKPQLGWAITNDGQRINGVARTLDGGCNWEQLWVSEDNPDERYSDIFFLNEREGWLAGNANGSLYHTTDGGRTWEDLPLPTESTKVFRVYFLDSAEGWIIAKPGVTGDAEGVFHTTDGGETWRKWTASEIISGLSSNSGRRELPANWKAGQLLRMTLRRQNE